MKKIEVYLDQATKLYTYHSCICSWKDARKSYCGEILASIIEIAKMMQNEDLEATRLHRCK